MECLFVIDIQKGFISDETEMILPKIKQLMSDFTGGIIVATQFVNTANSGFTDILHWGRLKQPPEIELIQFVKEKATYITQKFTYSACTDSVMQILSEFKIKEVYISGIDTDCCVLSTAIGLFERNIRPVVLEKYCASNGGVTSHKAAITVLERTIGLKQINFDQFARKREV